jgi:hypothetical protein
MVVTGPNGTLRVTQLDVVDGERLGDAVADTDGLGDWLALGIGRGVILR